MIALSMYILHTKLKMPLGRCFAIALPLGMIGDMLIALAIKGLLT